MQSTEVSCSIRCVNPAATTQARELLESGETYRDLAMLFGTLSDPTRARIVHVLLQQEMCTCDLALALEVTDSAISQHLRVLKSLRLVKARRAGKIVYYTLDDHHVAGIVSLGLSHLGHQEAADRLAMHSAEA